MKDAFKGFGSQLLSTLRKDAVLIIVWVSTLTYLYAGMTPLFQTITQGNGLLGIYALVQNPAMIAMMGKTPIVNPELYTMGALIAQMMVLFMGVISMILGAFYDISRTRHEEDEGISELLLSYPVGKHLQSSVSWVICVIVGVLTSVSIVMVMILLGTETMHLEGHVLYGISAGLATIMGASLGLVWAQVMPSASAAKGWTLLSILSMYALRGITDLKAENISKLNPLSWLGLTYPYTENNWVWVCFAMLFTFVLFIFVIILERNRDLGSGYVTELRGKDHASSMLKTLPGTLLRLNRALIISSVLGLFVMGIAYGSIFGELDAFIESNALIHRMFSLGSASLEASYASTILLLLGCLSMFIPITIMNRLVQEEMSGRLGHLVSRPISRTSIFLFNGLIALIATFLVLSGAGFGLGIGAMLSSNTTIAFSSFIGASLNYFSAIVFMIGLSSIIIGWKPSLRSITYFYGVLCIFVSYFKGIIKFPKWILTMIPQTHLAMMPMEKFNVSAFFVLTSIGILMFYIGLRGYRRRDFIEQK